MELIIDSSNNNQTAVNNFIDNTLQGSPGIIIFKAGVTLSSSRNFPGNVTLTFFPDSILVIPNASINVSIEGTINAGKFKIFQVPITGTFKIQNENIYPEWFELCSYQVRFPDPISNPAPVPLYDDDVAIQKAINASVPGTVVKLIGSFYRVNNTITVDTQTIHLMGKTVNYNGSVTGTTNNIGFSNNINVVNETLQNVIDIKKFGVKVSGLSFRAFDPKPSEKGVDTKGTALNYINFTSGAYYKDLDSEIFNCHFDSFKIGIYGEGANLRIIDNSFTACHTGVSINQVQQDNAGSYWTDNDNQNNKGNKANTRGHIISRNRFHSIGSYRIHPFLNGSTCVKINVNPGVNFLGSNHPESYTVKGYFNEITNNHADDCKTFFEGSVDRTKIDGNSILNSGGTAIKAFWGAFGSISDNIIDGSFTSNANATYYNTEQSYLPVNDGDPYDYAFPSGHGIQVRQSAYLKIHNNLIANKRSHGIYIEHGWDNSIQLNKITNYNRHAIVRVPNPIDPTGPSIYGINNPAGTTAQETSLYNGIHIKKTTVSIKDQKININNVVSNNSISIPHQVITTYNNTNPSVTVGYAIYAGDGDDLSFITNNFIVPTRIRLPLIKIEP